MGKALSLAATVALAATLTACSSEQAVDGGGEGFGGSISQGIPGDSTTTTSSPPDRIFEVPTGELKDSEGLPALSTVSGVLRHDRDCFVLATEDERVGLVFTEARGVEDGSGVYSVEWTDAGEQLSAGSRVSLDGYYIDPVGDSWGETGWASMCPDSEVQGLFKAVNMGE